MSIHTEGNPAIEQIRIPRVDRFPSHPQPYAYLDWKQRTRDYDRFVYDWHKDSEHPTIAWDYTHHNMDVPTFKMPAYYGDKRLDIDGYQDALNQIPSVIGPTLLGIDKSNQDGHDYVAMLQQFKHKYKNRKLVYNYSMHVTPHGHPHKDWWYDVGPSFLYYMVGDLYPDTTGMEENLRDIAEGLFDMVLKLGGPDADFNHQAYDFDADVPVDNLWKVPETGIAVAIVEYWAYLKFGSPKYLDAAKWSLNYFERIDFNPYYELFPSFGPYIAARMNVELGTAYDVTRYFHWMLSGSDVRNGYGTIEENWNGYDVYGLQGGRTDGGGYAFLLETAATAFFAPAVKYDHRIAVIVGKWLLNVCNAARFFYADQMPADRQFYGDKYIDAPEKVIAYEGLRKMEDGQSPRATGDPHAYGQKYWKISPETTDLGLYGSSWVGFLGAIFNQTNVPRILQIDCNALDFYKGACYPTYLYYNPYDEEKSVTIDLPDAADLFDAISGHFIAKDVSANVSFSIPADSALLLIVAPANGELSYAGNKTLINQVPVAYLPPN